MKTSISISCKRAIAIALILLMVTLLFGCANKSKKVATLIEDGSYEEATAAYRDLKVAQNSKAKDALIQALTDLIDRTVAQYEEGAITVEIVIERFDAISSFSISEMTAPVRGGLLQVAKEIVSGIEAEYQAGTIDAFAALDRLTQMGTTITNLSEDVFGSARVKLADQYMETVLGGYRDKTMSYEDCKAALEKLGKYDFIAKKVIEATAKITADHAAQSAYDLGMKQFEEGNYEQAIESLKKIPSDDIRYDAARELLERAEAQLTAKEQARVDDAIKQALGFMDGKDYDKAIAILNELSAQTYRIEEINTLLTKAQDGKTQKDIADKLAKTLKDAQSAFDQSDYARAFGTINAFVQSYGDIASEEIMKQLNDCYVKLANTYADQILAGAEGFAAEKDYDSAVELLGGALIILPDHEELKARLELYQSKRPVPLDTLDALIGGWKWNNGKPIDQYGNDYTGSKNYAILDDNGDRVSVESAEYRIYGKYVRISGRLIPYESFPVTTTAFLQIYADDQLVLTTPSINIKSDPVDFEAYIGGAEFFKIVVTINQEPAHWHHDTLILADMVLWPE